MKVLYLISGVGPEAGWGTEYIQNLIFELSKRNIQATIINPIYKHSHQDLAKWTKFVETKYQVKIIPLPLPKLITQNLMLSFIATPFFVTKKVIQLLKKERFDLIHEFSSTPVILFRAGIIRYFFKTSTVYTLSVYNNTFLGKFFWFKVFNFAKFYLIPSKEVLKQIQDLGISKNQLIFSPPGINLKLFKSLSQTLARKKLKFSKNKIIFIYFGSLTFEKGVDELIEAAKKINQSKFKNLQIIIASIWKGSNEHQFFVNKIKSLDLPFLELKDEFIDMPKLLAACDGVILPQRTGFGTTIPPISLLEAIASKKPVIVSNIIGVPELINNKIGILVSPNNPNILRAAIEKMARKTIKYSQPNFINDYDIKKSVRLHINIYKSIVNHET